jgi:hypothetical protein
LLGAYRREGAYTDCYTTTIAGVVSQQRYVEAFYTTCLFKMERFILRWALSRPSTDAQAVQLAAGSVDTFAAWRVEARSENQLLLCDMHERTRSWLMVRPLRTEHGVATRLYFGSALVPVRKSATGRNERGRTFRVLLGFHRVYSVALLRAARRRLHSEAAAARE